MSESHQKTDWLKELLFIPITIGLCAGLVIGSIWGYNWKAKEPAQINFTGKHGRILHTSTIMPGRSLTVFEIKNVTVEEMADGSRIVYMERFWP